MSEGCSSGVGGMDVGTTRFLVGENVRTLTKHDTYVNWSKGGRCEYLRGWEPEMHERGRSVYEMTYQYSDEAKCAGTVVQLVQTTWEVSRD